jgi:hypothetical protein
VDRPRKEELMQSQSNINSANGQFLTQAEKIEALLRSRYGQWIPAYELSDLALQYCARINSIRKKLKRAGDTEEIQNKTQRVNGQVHGSYRICRTENVRPDTRHARAAEFERRFRPGWQSRPFSEKRMAQDDCFVLTPPEPRS